MKKSFLYFLFIFLIVSCSHDLSEESIVGTWKITDFETNTKLSPMLIASAKEIAITTVYELNENHQFTMTSSFDREGVIGTWKLDVEQSHIQFNNAENEFSESAPFKIKEFNSEKMIWIEDVGDLGTCTYTLQKQ